MLAVPHGNPGENRAALDIARLLDLKLVDSGFDSALLATAYTRKKDALEVIESRDRTFRKAVDEVLKKKKGTRLFLDVHSFRPMHKKFAGKDIVLLHTEGQDLAFLKHYAFLLKKAARKRHYKDFVCRVEKAVKSNDLCRQAKELGSDTVVCVEHNDLVDAMGSANYYAPLHVFAIKKLAKERGWG
jgi:hypothetical protein